MAAPTFYSQTSNVANEKYQALYDIVHLVSRVAIIYLNKQKNY